MRPICLNNRVQSGTNLWITLPLLQLEAPLRPSLFPVAEPLELTPAVLISRERQLRLLGAEVELLRDLILEGNGTAEFPKSTLLPLKNVGQFSRQILLILDRFRSGESIREFCPHVPEENAAEFVRGLADSMGLSLDGIRRTLTDLHRGVPHRDEVCRVIGECMQVETNRRTELSELPVEWETSLRALAYNVDSYMPDDQKGLRAMMKSSLMKLATYRQNKPHWSDQTASPKMRRKSVLMDDLAYKALTVCLEYLCDNSRVQTSETRETVFQKCCSDFLEGVHREDLTTSSPETLLARSPVITHYTNGLLALASTGMEVEEYFEGFFRRYNSEIIRKREVEVFGCELGKLMSDTLEIVKEVQRLKNNSIASSTSLNLGNDLRGSYLLYAGFLSGMRYPGIPPDMLHLCVLRMNKKARSCYRLCTKRNVKAVEEEMEVKGGGRHQEGGLQPPPDQPPPDQPPLPAQPEPYSSELANLRMWKSLFHQTLDLYSYIYPVEAIGELLLMNDPLARSSVHNDQYMSHLMSQFARWTTGSIDKYQVMNLHSLPMIWKWGGFGQRAGATSASGAGGDLLSACAFAAQGHHPLRAYAVAADAFAALHDAYAYALQDLVTDMATLTPCLTGTLPRNGMEVMIQPWCEILFYSDEVKLMIQAGQQIIQDWCAHNEMMDALRIFQDVGFRILSDRRTPAHLKLAQISRLWRIIEMSGLVNKRGTQWEESWDEMEVLEYAIFDDAGKITHTAFLEGFRIAEKLLYWSETFV